CATVCPSGALYFGSRDEIEALRKTAVPTNRFLFGRQVVHTKVHMMVPRERTPEYVDVTAALADAPTGQDMSLNVLSDICLTAMG
ncbi:MAG: 4Fe-4S ferredoxin, partial [Planctomycetota bacterium]